MRWAIVLAAALALLVVLTVSFRGAEEPSFDERFESADAKLDELSRSIEEDIEASQSSR